jgi:hypothetical protein
VLFFEVKSTGCTAKVELSIKRYTFSYPRSDHVSNWSLDDPKVRELTGFVKFNELLTKANT